MLADDVEILSERSDPVLAAELFAVLTLGNQGDDVPSVAHLDSPVSDFDRAGLTCGRLESWRLHVSYALGLSNGVHREVRFLQSNCVRPVDSISSGPAAIDVAKLTTLRLVSVDLP